jgi:antitoxin (DNA-binding transcriptional repressor) of toxin-antitoxin stability system
MRAVGIRELKNKLSHYVHLVEAGESVLVTDRGTVVAEMHPPGPTTQRLGDGGVAPGLLELVRSGRAVPGGPHDPEAYSPRTRALPHGRLEELLDAERSDEPRTGRTRSRRRRR